MKYIRSFEDFEAVVQLGETVESTYLDFKSQLNLEKKNSYEEMALDIVQFANSFGGVLIFGVSEKYCSDRNKKIAHSYQSVDFERVSKALDNNVRKLIYPESISIEANSISTPSGYNLVAINVYPLAVGLGCVGQKSEPFAMKYPYRTTYGKKYFHPAEVEKYLSGGGREILIKLDELSARGKKVKAYPGLIIEKSESRLAWDIVDPAIVITDYNYREVTFNFGGVTFNLPVRLITDVWHTEQEEVGMIFDANLRLTSDRREIKLELRG